MTDQLWQHCMTLLRENQERFEKMRPADPMPKAQWCRESPHRTLGHLTSCQTAWLPILRAIRDEQVQVVIAIHPNPLFRKMKFGSSSWAELLKRFQDERAEWHAILQSADLNREVRTQTKSYTAKSLSRRLVEHEKRHLDDLEVAK